MYTWAQCTVQKRLLCSGDVPCVAPLHLEHIPPPHLPGVLGAQFTSNLGPGWTGSYHTKEGFQVSKRDGRKTDKELARGVKKGNCALAYTVSLYMYIIIV